MRITFFFPHCEGLKVPSTQNIAVAMAEVERAMYAKLAPRDKEQYTER
jgi:hypothetical protein